MASSSTSESDSLPVSSAVQSTKVLREPIQTTKKIFTLCALIPRSAQVSNSSPKTTGMNPCPHKCSHWMCGDKMHSCLTRDALRTLTKPLLQLKFLTILLCDKTKIRNLVFLQKYHMLVTATTTASVLIQHVLGFPSAWYI